MPQVLKPAVFIIAALYFAADELFSSVAKPIADWLARWRVLGRVREWIANLRPYPALALFIVPLIVLEPVKPVATYFVATGHFMTGALIFAIGETLKLVVVERLFQINRNKLMTIPAFAWCYFRIRMVFSWLESFAIWNTSRRMIAQLKTLITERIKWRRASRERDHLLRRAAGATTSAGRRLNERESRCAIK